MIFNAQNRTYRYRYNGIVQIFNLLGQWGAMDEQGTKTIITFTHEDYVSVINALEKQGFTLSTCDKNVVQEGCHIVCISGKYGIVDEKGNIILNFSSPLPFVFE